MNNPSIRIGSIIDLTSTEAEEKAWRLVHPDIPNPTLADLMAEEYPEANNSFPFTKADLDRINSTGPTQADEDALDRIFDEADEKYQLQQQYNTPPTNPADELYNNALAGLVNLTDAEREQEEIALENLYYNQNSPDQIEFQRVQKEWYEERNKPIPKFVMPSVKKREHLELTRQIERFQAMTPEQLVEYWKTMPKKQINPATVIHVPRN